MGTKFTVYDNGTNPCKNPGALLEESNTRQELAAICYVSDSDTHTAHTHIRPQLVHNIKMKPSQSVCHVAGNQRAGIQRTT